MGRGRRPHRDARERGLPGLRPGPSPIGPNLPVLAASLAWPWGHRRQRTSGHVHSVGWPSSRRAQPSGAPGWQTPGRTPCPASVLSLRATTALKVGAQHRLPMPDRSLSPSPPSPTRHGLPSEGWGRGPFSRGWGMNLAFWGHGDPGVPREAQGHRLKPACSHAVWQSPLSA